MITNLSKGQENVIGGGSEHMGTGKDKKPKKEKKIRKVVWFRLRTIDFRQLQFGWMKDGSKLPLLIKNICFFSFDCELTSFSWIPTFHKSCCQPIVVSFWRTPWIFLSI